MSLTSSAFNVYNAISKEFKRGVDYTWLGGQVMWIRVNGILVRRFIAGTNTLSQHVGGNAFDLGSISTGAADIAKIDRAVLIAKAHPDCGRVLWRGVRNHYPHHAHIEGKPALTQAQLWAFYENAMEEDMTVAELVEELQKGMVAAGYDLGTYGPNSDGVDGDWGAKSAAAWQKVCEDAKKPASNADHRHNITLPSSITTSNPL